MLTKLARFQLQAKFLSVTRQFLASENFTEVITPVLQPCVPLEPTIYPFQTRWQNDQTFWLSTSPEKTLKMSLAAGLNQVYSIGHSFRDLEQAGAHHKPEFLMLEWYRKNSNLAQIQQDVKNLLNKFQTVVGANPKVDLQNWQTISLAEEFKKSTGLSLSQVATDKSMQEFAISQGYNTADSTWEQLFNQWFLNHLEPKLGNLPTFLIDFPARISPLCSLQASRPELADRFEVYLNGIEVGNGNLDQTDSVEVKVTFEAERNWRQSQKLPAPEIDQEFLTSLDQLQGQNLAGIGLGLERIWMILADEAQIN